MPKTRNNPDFSSALLRRARLEKELTQSEVGEAIGVSTAMVSFWETGRAVPNADRWRKLCEVLDIGPSTAKRIGDESVGAVVEEIRRVMKVKGLNQKRIAELARVSQPTVSNVLNGKYLPREETLGKIARAADVHVHLGTSGGPGTGRTEDNEFGIGGTIRWKFFDPDRRAKADWPTCAGVYMLCDERDRAVYVGQGKNISKRCKNHEQKFWYKAPSVVKAYYVAVDGDVLRGHLETLLIQCLGPHNVFNENLTDREGG